MATGSTQHGEGGHPGQHEADSCAEAARIVLARHHERVACGQQNPVDLIEPEEPADRPLGAGAKNGARPSSA